MLVRPPVVRWRRVALLALIAGVAGTARAIEQPPVVTPVVTPVAAPSSAPAALALQHDPQNAAHLSAADGRLSIRFRATAGSVRRATVHADDGAAADTAPRVMLRQAPSGDDELWRGTLPEGVTRYRIRVESARGVEAFGPFTVPAVLFRAIPWVGGSVGYQIFPERFQNGDPTNDSLALTTDERAFVHWATPVLRPWTGAPVTEQLCCHEYFGGDLAGITQRLDSLQALGVSLLYLNPIFSSGSAHGYDSWDFRQVEPSFGTEATLRTLLQQANARGMRVLFDFVPNHVGLGFAGFQDALRHGTASPWWRWFTFTAPAGQVQAGNPAHYATFAGSGAMPKLNTANAEVQTYLLDIARRWLAFGFDGVRVDVPNELTNAADFARALRRTAKSARADAYLVGEIWQRAPQWVQGDQFDALMHYAVGQDILEPFAAGRLSAVDAANQLGRVFGEYPEASTAMAFNVIATHDTPRLLSKLGGGGIGATPAADVLARARLVSAMLFAMPGVPVTFQGDECGFTGAMNENRYPVQWDRCSTSMRAHYQLLATVRRSTPALGSAAFRLASANGSVLGWYRGEAGPGEVLALFNAASAPATVSLPDGRWTDLVAQATVSGLVPVEAFGWRYLVQIAPR
jgi:cyclomaltodextrinase